MQVQVRAFTTGKLKMSNIVDITQVWHGICRWYIEVSILQKSDAEDPNHVAVTLDPGSCKENKYT